MSRNAPATPFRTVLEVLEFADPVVRNVLVDQSGIESIMLVDDSQQMQDYMSAQVPTVDRDPKSIKDSDSDSVAEYSATFLAESSPALASYQGHH